MIFESVNKISNKKAFIELILIYIRMVEVIAYRNNKTIALISEPSDIICDELKDMGVIESSNDIPILKKLVGHDYVSLISAIAFYLANKELYGTQLYKLSNKHRKNLQEQSLSKKEPSFVDFFAGAGGLSCGFTQAGYRATTRGTDRAYRDRRRDGPIRRPIRQNARAPAGTDRRTTNWANPALRGGARHPADRDCLSHRHQQRERARRLAHPQSLRLEHDGSYYE